MTAERHPYAVEAICREGYEVGVHGYTHDRPDSMSLEEEEHLSKAKEVLTRMTGQNIRGYISPSWEYSTNTLHLLRKHGFEYAADAMDEDVPYYLKIDGEQTDMVQLPINWTLDDAPLYWFSFLPPLNYGAPYAEPSRAFEPRGSAARPSARPWPAGACAGGGPKSGSPALIRNTREKS